MNNVKCIQFFFWVCCNGVILSFRLLNSNFFMSLSFLLLIYICRRHITDIINANDISTHRKYQSLWKLLKNMHVNVLRREGKPLTSNSIVIKYNPRLWSEVYSAALKRLTLIPKPLYSRAQKRSIEGAKKR